MDMGSEIDAHIELLSGAEAETESTRVGLRKNAHAAVDLRNNSGGVSVCQLWVIIIIEFAALVVKGSEVVGRLDKGLNGRKEDKGKFVPKLEPKWLRNAGVQGQGQILVV